MVGGGAGEVRLTKKKNGHYLIQAWRRGGRGVEDQKKSNMLDIKWLGRGGSQKSNQIHFGDPESLGPRTIFHGRKLAFWAGLAALRTKSDVSGPDLYQSRSGSPAQIKGGRGGDLAKSG